MAGDNVLILMSDEHARSVMGAYGNDIVQTPALDRLATAGVRFDNAYTPSPICISARASFATGKAVFEHQCWSSAEPYYGQHESWMHRLRTKGHDVVSIGKLHYRSAADDLGFTEQMLPMYLANNGTGWPQALLRKPMADFPGSCEMAALLGPGETSYTRYDRNVTAAAVDWLAQQPTSSENPWVLFVSFICPHYPLSAPEEFYELYRRTDIPPPYDRDPGRYLKHPVLDQMRQFWDYADHFDRESELTGLRNYYGLCSFLDNNIAQVLEALNRAGHADTTQIIYTSDHGEMVGNHGIWGKSYMYEDSVGIPMTISGPDIPTGTNGTAVSLVDLAATVERSVGGSSREPEAPWQGRPLQGFIDQPESERPVLSEYHDGGSPCGFFMLRKGRWKLVYFSEGNQPLLFDMQDDPSELRNLSRDDRYADTLESMCQELFNILDPEQVNCQALSDQRAMIETLGGLSGIASMESFNHTPIE